MGWIPWWVAIPVVWWLGMLPAAYLAGAAERKKGAAYGGGAKAVVIIGWPLILVMMPIDWAMSLGRKPPQHKGKGDA